MADSRVFIVIILLVIYVESTALSGKGLFCRDPDTGKLYPVNSTWSSTTFCGNFTCKQRRLNTTQPQFTLRVLNVTGITNHNKNENITEKPVTIDLEPDLKSRINIDKDQKNYTNFDDEDDDRFLTDSEIKTISDILHTVRRSDLDAIIDIYNLAQEIYNELDKETDQTAVDEAVNNVKEKLDSVHLKLSNTNTRYVKPASYWYDWKSKAEMDTQTTNIVPTTAKVKMDTPSYFNGPLNRKDFGKIPYYYPISSFQRSATYVHQPVQTTPSAIVDKPYYQRQPVAPPAPVNSKDSQKLIKPSYLLPYPFTYVHNYNITKYPKMYYSNPWVWDYYYKNRQTNPYFKAYIAQIPNAVLVNPDLSEPIQDIEQKPVQKPKKYAETLFEKDAKPDWKTEPLSKHIINEIKANIDTSKLIKAFPLRKKVKVERVGKVIKMDELTRHKRDSEINKPQEEEFEAYISRVTCEEKMEPGYFRYGNLTQPYPHCCPQLILNR